MSNIIQLFRDEQINRICANCHHAALSQDGVFCLTYNETIVDERKTALECEAYEGPEDTTVLSTNGNGNVAVLSPKPDPYAPVEVPDELVMKCRSYLDSLHTSGWGQFYAIKDRNGEGLDRAAKWLAETIMRVNEQGD